jgi:hypothetical protein
VAAFVPKKGERYAVTTAFDAIVTTHWGAPFTGGERRVLPDGLEFVIADEPIPGATAVYAIPEPREVWEARLVAERDRTADAYAGYSLSLMFADIEAFCARIDA